jgi:hypothetical protein
MQADNAYPPEGPEPAPDAARLSMVPTHAIPLDKEQPLDGSSSASNPTLVQKSDTLRGSSDVATVWDMDQLQEARLEMTHPTRKEHVIEGQYAIPLILQDDELLEAQQGAVSAHAVDELARTAGGHDELMHDLVTPPSSSSRSNCR